MTDDSKLFPNTRDLSAAMLMCFGASLKREHCARWYFNTCTLSWLVVALVKSESCTFTTTGPETSCPL